jgi:hypothetical protein
MANLTKNGGALVCSGQLNQLVDQFIGFLAREPIGIIPD